MQTNRRKFLAAGVASLSTAAVSAQFAQDAKAEQVNKPEANQREDTVAEECLDYGLSFICSPTTDNPSGNAVRFWVESRTTLIDDKAGTSTVFYQCASCKSEHTFAEQDLFQADNYDFLPIFGDEDLLVFRRTVRLTDKYRTLAKAAQYWGKPILKLRRGKNVKVLDNWEKIRAATAAALPIVSQTELENTETGLRAIIECPVKTLNISLDKDIYQVDTGPIAYPDLTKRYEVPIDCLSLAFIAFNAPHFADFVIEQPTPVAEDGQDACQVYHYSKPFSVPAKNRLLSLLIEEYPGPSK